MNSDPLSGLINFGEEGDSIGAPTQRRRSRANSFRILIEDEPNQVENESSGINIDQWSLLGAENVDDIQKENVDDLSKENVAELHNIEIYDDVTISSLDTYSLPSNADDDDVSISSLSTSSYDNNSISSSLTSLNSDHQRHTLQDIPVIRHTTIVASESNNHVRGDSVTSELETRVNMEGVVIPGNGAGDETPETVTLFQSEVWEMESYQIENMAISHCSFNTRAASGDFKAVDDGWILLVRKRTSLYAGLFLFDAQLVLHSAIPLETQTIINCDEDLIGTGHRKVTICYHNLESSRIASESGLDYGYSSSSACKAEVILSDKYKDMEQDLFTALEQILQLYSAKTAPDIIMSSDWHSKNRSWVEQFTTKAQNIQSKLIPQSQSAMSENSAQGRSETDGQVPSVVLRPTSPGYESQPGRRFTFNETPRRKEEGALFAPDLTRRPTTNLVSSHSRPTSPNRRPKIFREPEVQKYVEFRRLKVFVTTFNVNMQTSGDENVPPVMGLRQVVKDWLQVDQMSRDPQDIMVICLQECGGLNRAKNFFSSQDAKIQNDWKRAISEVLRPLKLECFNENNVGCTYMLVYVSSSYIKDVSLHHKADLPLGSGGWTANKGATLIQIGIQSSAQIFSFVGVHLAAHDNAREARMKQIDRICDEFQDLLSRSSFVFWMGDFNFRTATSDPIITEFDFLLLKNKKNEQFSDYRSKDEWKQWRLDPEAEKNFFYNMSESHITFAPSYKFQANETSSTDLSTGLEILPYVTTHRPSWCDRIFYYAKEGYNSDSRPLQVTKYDCEFKCVLSDHKPVFATVLAEIEYLNLEKKSKELRETEIHFNSIRPGADLDQALHNIPNEVECFKMQRTYQIDSHLTLKDDVIDVVFLFRCSCGDSCRFYDMQFGAKDIKEDRELIEHVRTHNSPVSFVKVNQHYGRITRGCNTSIGFDLQITERNIHELYKLHKRPFAKLVSASKSGTKFEQLQIDLIFCQYRVNDHTKEWFKGADRYIAVNLNVKTYMHGLSPTALCFIEKPLCQTTMAEVSEIVTHSQTVLRPGSVMASAGADKSSGRLPTLPTFPVLDCPKEIVKALDALVHFIDSIRNQHRKMKFVTSLFVGKNIDLSEPAPPSAAATHLALDVPIYSDFASDVVDDSTDTDSVDGVREVVVGSKGDTDPKSQEYLDEAIDWLTGVTNYNKSPYQTEQENANFFLGLSAALLLYFKSIEHSLFGKRTLPTIHEQTTHVQLLESVKVAQHNKLLIGYFFAFLAETVMPLYLLQLNSHISHKLIYFTRAEAHFRDALDTFKTTLVEACFTPSDSNEEYDARMQTVEVLLRRPSTIKGTRGSVRPPPLIDLS